MLGIILIQESLISGLRLALARLDLVFILVFFWSIAKGGNTGLFLAFVAGLLMDLVSGGPGGLFTISLPLVAFLLALTSEYVSYTNPFALFSLAGLLFILYDLMQLTILHFLGYSPFRAESILLITLPSALLNAVATVPVCLILARLYRGGRIERE